MGKSQTAFGSPVVFVLNKPVALCRLLCAYAYQGHAEAGICRRLQRAILSPTVDGGTPVLATSLDHLPALLPVHGMTLPTTN